MRPIKLIIEGINSFDAPQTLDFEAVGRNNLFCISGKTGAGKTTIFDSIMLALYGRSGKGNLADVVNLSRTTARIAFDFTENGDIYTIERNIKCRVQKAEKPGKTDGTVVAEKRSATSECALYKNGALIANGEDATQFLEGIIGLEASEFKNVYLLEQGEYADFLKKTPSEQNTAVGKIFSLMRFGDVYKLAGERQREQESEAETQTKIMESLGDVSQDKLAGEKTALSALKARTTALKKDGENKRAELDTLEKAQLEFISVREKMNNVKSLMLQADEQKKKQSDAETELAEFEKTADNSAAERIKALNETLNDLSALNSIDKEYSAAVKTVEEKTAACEKKQSQVAEIEENIKAFSAQCDQDKAAFFKECKKFTECAAGIEKKSNALEHAIKAIGAENANGTTVVEIGHALKAEKTAYDALIDTACKQRERHAQKQSACERILQVIEKYTAELKEIGEQKRIAEQTTESAAKALSEAMLHSHAAAVRAELHNGDVCPVCGGVYNGGGAEGDSDVEKRKEEHETAVKNLKAVTEKETDCVKLLDRNKSDYEHENAEKVALADELTETENKAKQTFVDSEVYLKLFEILRSAKTAGDKAEESMSKLAEQQPKIAAFKAEEAAARAAADEAREKAEQYKTTLGDNCGKTDGQIEKVRAEKSELEKQCAETEGKRKQLSGEVEAAKAAVETVLKSLEAARADCPVDMPQFDEDKYTEQRGMLEQLTKRIVENEKEIAVKEAQLMTLAENCDRLAECEAKRSAFLKRAKLYETVAKMTYKKGMLNYVAAEYIAEFTAAASEILNDLSHGKYTMRYDENNGFVVTDYLNGGKSRKTDTLSGGELFLASLSVAIAIARTQSKGNNAFFFLDEGFGTLDEELIDTVYGALESLSRDCLVGVISHAAALIDRMPSCVEVLEATDTMGSIIKY